MKKEEAFVGLRVRYVLRQQYNSHKNGESVKKEKQTSVYGTIIKLHEKEAVVRHAPNAEIGRPYEKLEPVV